MKYSMKYTKANLKKLRLTISSQIIFNSVNPNFGIELLCTGIQQDLIIYLLILNIQRESHNE